jgi:hypothetical protein
MGDRDMMNPFIVRENIGRPGFLHATIEFWLLNPRSEPCANDFRGDIRMIIAADETK